MPSRPGLLACCRLALDNASDTAATASPALSGQLSAARFARQAATKGSRGCEQVGPGLLQCSLSQGCCLTASRLGLALGSTVSRLRMRASQPGGHRGWGGLQAPLHDVAQRGRHAVGARAALHANDLSWARLAVEI